MARRITALSILAVMVVLSFGTIGSFAEGAITIDDVLFFNGDKPVYVSEPGNIKAAATITSGFAEPKDVMVLVSSYDGNQLKGVSASYVTLKQGVNYLEPSNAVPVENENNIVKFMVWDMANLEPFAKPVSLTDVSNQKEITKFDITMGKLPFSASINNRTRTITVHVTTRRTNTTTNLSNDLNPTVFANSKTAVTPVIDGVGTITADSGTTVQDFTNPVTYTVVAADGTSVKYTAKLEEVILQRATDFNANVEETPSTKPRVPQRWHMPDWHGTGSGEWRNEGYAYDEANEYVLTPAIDPETGEEIPAKTSSPLLPSGLTQTASIVGLTQYPLNSANKVFRFEKREEMKSLSGVCIMHRDTASTMDIKKIVYEMDFMYEELYGYGMFILTGGDKHNHIIFNAQDADEGKYKIKWRPRDGGPISDVPGAPQFNFNEWNKLRTVYTIEEIEGTGQYVGKTEVYINGKYISTLVNDDPTTGSGDNKTPYFPNTRNLKLNFFGSGAHGIMYLDNFAVSFQP